ncbi:TPA: hypothetical protein G9F26_003973 [Salmonella enterica]|uniref:Uncharacterized protein n=1 Tax=Salmonella enterica TaxID=28901 RepID=A0A750HZF4_SALER|nr:hypothetical protein [Salmonella enterica]
MNELACLHPQISELSEYEQYLLSALLRKAAADAGRNLNITERRTVAAAFFASRLTDRKTHDGYRRRATAALRKKATFTGNRHDHDADDERQTDLISIT